VLGVSLLVCLVGAAADASEAFTHAWTMIAVASALAAAAAVGMDARPVPVEHHPAAVPASAT